MIKKNSIEACIFILMYIVDADGKRLDKEIKALRKLSIHLNLFTRDPFKKNNLDKCMLLFDIENNSLNNRELQKNYVYYLKKITSPELSLVLLSIMLGIAVSDNDYDLTEKKYIEQAKKVWNL